MKSQRAEWIIFGCYLILLVGGLWTHELWVDETRAWIIARDLGLGEMQKALETEYHPVGWYALLKLLQSAGFPPSSMKFISGFFSALAFAVLIFRSPFTRLQKSLFIFNVYFLYQYGVMSRPYGLELLFLFCLCSIYHSRLERPYLWAGLIVLLSLSHTFGFLMAPVFVLRSVLDYSRKKNVRHIVLALAGVFSSLLLMKSFSSGTFGFTKFGPVIFQRLIQALSFCLQGIYLVIPLTEDYWERSFWTTYEIPAFIAVFLIIPLLVVYYRHSKEDKFAFYVSVYGWSLIVFILTFYTYSGFNINHLGQGFIFLLCGLWILRRSGGHLITAAIALQAIAGGHCYLSDLRRPYSRGWDVAEFLRSQGEASIVADLPFFSSSWLVYGSRKITLQSGEERTFAVINQEIFTDLPNPDNFPLRDFPGGTLRSSTGYLRKSLEVAWCGKKRKTLLISNYQLSPGEASNLCLSEHVSFTGAINPMENFSVYQLVLAEDCRFRCPN